MFLSDLDEEGWEAKQRALVLRYLAAQDELVHGAPGEAAAWLLAPYVSIWAVESNASSGDVGWWVIAGDLPTDYASSGEAGTPRSALRTFGVRWKALAAGMRSGRETEGVSIGTPDSWPELAPLLEARADLLLEFAADDSLWAETLS
mgnify:FL=1